MYYCERCRNANKWPNSFVSSHGPCEVCGTVALCWDRASSDLPPRDPEDFIVIDDCEHGRPRGTCAEVPCSHSARCEIARLRNILRAVGRAVEPDLVKDAKALNTFDDGVGFLPTLVRHAFEADSETVAALTAWKQRASEVLRNVREVLDRHESEQDSNEEEAWSYCHSCGEEYTHKPECPWKAATQAIDALLSSTGASEGKGA